MDGTIVCGVTAVEGDDGGELPLVSVAVTVNAKDAPLVRPVVTASGAPDVAASVAGIVVVVTGEPLHAVGEQWEAV